MSELLWRPSEERIANANITRFMTAIESEYRQDFSGDYFALQSWALQYPELFWRKVWDFTQIASKEVGDTVLEDGDKLPGARWFPEARLNFAENVLARRDDKVALVSLLENGRRRETTYSQLYSKVAQLASSLRKLGIQPGDRVVGFLPNIEEAVVAMLAATSLGATWSSCSPDFGINGVMDRFGQIEPRVLFAADGYVYNGKSCDSLQRVAAIAQQIDSLEQVVVVPVLEASPPIDTIRNAVSWDSFLDNEAKEIDFTQLPFDHPLYILYSSGTTGIPKAIVHGAGGTLLQHKKEHSLLVDMDEEDVFFYFTTCGWMMWNWLVSGLAIGATLVLYDGSPFADDGNVLLDAIDNEGITVFGVGAKYIASLQKSGLCPRDSHQLDSLKTILSTGSPLVAENFEYIYREFKADVCLSSISGGTDIISCFVGGCPILPVYSGQLQSPGLGMAVQIWNDDGQPVSGEKGELVCVAPFPSAPVGFWNDDSGSRYRAAYFDSWPGVWAHGDYGEQTEEGGYVIHGRSDAVLNPGGVRIGTAEIYRQVEKVEAVLESVVIGKQEADDVRVILFVVLQPGKSLDERLSAEIRQTIRQNATPRHVPAEIFQVTDIPRTISGKIAELAVRDVVHGRTVKNTDALANPEALELYRDILA